MEHAIASHDTFSTVFQMIDPNALDPTFDKVLADVAALLRAGDVIAVDGKSVRGACDGGRVSAPGLRSRPMSRCCA